MELLENLLKAEDFKAAVENLARDYRREKGLPPVHQLGVVVPDVERAAAELEKRGVSPFFIASGKPVFWRERGEERRFSGKLGMGYFQGIEIELLEPGEGSDFYRDCLDPEGRPVVQHLGFIVDDLEEELRRAEDKGMPLLIRGQLKAGPLRIDFAYLDTMEQAGLVMEVESYRLFGARAKPLPGLMRFLGRLEKATGKRSISL